jgi:hypothetical protein
MFVHDAPPAINFAQTHRQSKFEGFTFAVRIDVDAPPNCGSEGDILTASDFHIVESKRNGFSADAKNVSQEVNAASFARFRFAKANESKDCQMKRAQSDHDGSAS